MAQKKKTAATKSVTAKKAVKKAVAKKAAVKSTPAKKAAAKKAPTKNVAATQSASTSGSPASVESSKSSSAPKLQPSTVVVTQGSDDHSDPSTEPRLVADRALPIWVLVLLGVLIWWGNQYLIARGGQGRFDSQVYTPYKNTDQLEALAAARDPEKLFLLQGKNLFMANCAVCHQVTGAGQPGVFPPLAGSDWVNGVGPNRIIRIVLNGLAGEVEVNGTTYNNAMVGLGGVLSDDDIAAILSYVRTNDLWGNNSEKVSPEQVAAVRAAVGGRSAQWSAAELLAIPHSD